MKKIILLFIICFLFFTIKGQNTFYHPINDIGGIRIGATNHYLMMATPETPVFNILDYGATSGGGSVSAAIQTAINAARASLTVGAGFWTGYSGKVYIPAGEWYITVADTLKEFVYVDVANGARFHFPAGYTGDMWVNPSNSRLEHSGVTGGFYDFADDNLANCIHLHNDVALNYAQGIVFKDMRIWNCNFGVLIDGNGLSYAASNTFQNFYMFDCKQFFKIWDGTGQHISDITVQMSAIVDTVINIKSNANSINRFMVWDWGLSDHEVGIYIHPDNYWNYIEMPTQSNNQIKNSNNIIDGNGTRVSDNINMDAWTTSSGDYQADIAFEKKRDADGNVHNGDKLGSITFRGFNTANYYDAATILATNYGTPGVGDMPGEMEFAVSDDGTAAPTTRLRINWAYISAHQPVAPYTDNLTSLGTSSLGWSALHLHTGAAVNWENGGATMTGTVDDITVAGAHFTAPDLTTNAGDTTVTAVIGRMVFKTSDTHFYGCKKLVGKKWYQLDN